MECYARRRVQTGGKRVAERGQLLQITAFVEVFGFPGAGSIDVGVDIESYIGIMAADLGSIEGCWDRSRPDHTYFLLEAEGSIPSEAVTVRLRELAYTDDGTTQDVEVQLLLDHLGLTLAQLNERIAWAAAGRLCTEDVIFRLAGDDGKWSLIPEQQGDPDPVETS
jgi:hypothetical protein